MRPFIILLTAFFIYSCASENWETRKLQAENAINSKDYSTAIKILEKAIEKFPENAEAHYYLGQAYRLKLFSNGALINDVDLPYAELASNEFKKAIEISPKYTGKKFVVDPYSKIQSIWGAVAFDYVFNNKIDSARVAFEKGKIDGAYYPAIVEYNQNIMASCDKNAILFTNGDNDTYPMWYLQLINKYRKDITVVNLSLLNVGWYIKMLKNNYSFGENNLSINLTEDQINTLKPAEWNEKQVELPAKHDPLSEAGKISWNFKPTIENKALRIQDLMIIEILKVNDWNRPVYFSTTVYNQNRIGLDDYLTFEGLVYRLESHKAKISQEKLRSNLLDVYGYQGVKDKHLEYVEDCANLYQNYRYAFIDLISQYIGNKQLSDAKKTLFKMEEILPEKTLAYHSEQMKEQVEDLKKKSFN